MWLERERKGRRREGEGGREGRCDVFKKRENHRFPRRYSALTGRPGERLGTSRQLVRLFRIKQYNQFHLPPYTRNRGQPRAVFADRSSRSCSAASPIARL